MHWDLKRKKICIFKEKQDIIILIHQDFAERIWIWKKINKIGWMMPSWPCNQMWSKEYKKGEEAGGGVWTTENGWQQQGEGQQWWF